MGKAHNFITTHLTGKVRSPLRLSISLWGTGYHLKFSFQLKPPYVMSEPAMYSNVSSLMTSMMGQTTAFLQSYQLILLRGLTHMLLSYSGMSKQETSFTCLFFTWSKKKNTYNLTVITVYKSYATSCLENASCHGYTPKELLMITLNPTSSIASHLTLHYIAIYSFGQGFYSKQFTVELRSVKAIAQGFASGSGPEP